MSLSPEINAAFHNVRAHEQMLSLPVSDEKNLPHRIAALNGVRDIYQICVDAKTVPPMWVMEMIAEMFSVLSDLRFKVETTDRTRAILQMTMRCAICGSDEVAYNLCEHAMRKEYNLCEITPHNRGRSFIQCDDRECRESYMCLGCFASCG